MDPFLANETPVNDDARIAGRYPGPLARAWQRVLIASPRAAFHHRQLLVLAETLVDYVAAIALAAYAADQAAGAPPDPTLNRSLRSLRRPTFGQWLGWAAAGLVAVPPEGAPVPGLAAAYETPHADLMLTAYEGLRGIMVVQLDYTGEYGAREAVSPRLLLELLNQYQLRLARHPPAPAVGFDEMAVIAVLGPGLRTVLGHLAVLAAYPLLALARGEAGAIEVLRLQGLDVVEAAVELEPGAAPPGTLLLADAEDQPMLVLDPWMIFAACPECGQVQVAVFAGREGDVLQYHGLECEHTWTQGPEVALPQVGVREAAEPWAPGAAGPPPEAPTDMEAALYARFEAEAQALAAERQARRAPAAPAPREPPAPAHTDASEVYRDLLEQRAFGGLTLDELQHLDEERAAAEAARRRAGPATPPEDVTRG